MAVLLAVAAAAWALAGVRMDGMDAGPGTELGGLGSFTASWVMMMAAMMLPSIAPMVLAHARGPTTTGAGGARGARGATAAFVVGYMATWAAVGLLAYTVIEGGRSLGIGGLAWDEGGRYLAGGVILAAAVYQLTGPKDASLRHCRSPLLLREHWRPGRLGGLRMGTEHGGFCVRCCWALMAAQFALGVMSITWMVGVAVLIATEKLAPWPVMANRGIAIALTVLAVAVAFAPDQVPALTIPGSHGAM